VEGNAIILGAVGVLQFDVAIARLKAEYGVEATYEPVDYAAARWVHCDDRAQLEAFVDSQRFNMAHDGDGNLTYLAGSEWQLNYVGEKWPKISFLKTREQQ
jgi:peptide chain release factor 3